MSVAATQISDEPDPGYWHDMAVERLSAQPGLKPGASATKCEKLLWKRLVALQAAAYRVLSDVDDDGVAEAHDMAVQGLREAVDAAPKALPGKRSPMSVTTPAHRQITTL